ncbi:MAG TPA: cysteine hydrolase family protein [Acidobacteriota bacterium]|nr:cysteine hydrolase family protein [Acidobacteriota bacterium]
MAGPPRTLLGLTKAAPPPSGFRESVVLVIDAQREYVDGQLPLAHVAEALRQTQRLLARARAAGVPVIHIQQVSPRGRGVFEDGGPFVVFAPEAAPLSGELILTKKLPNAFAGTPLDDALRQLGRKHVIISGYMTHMCVSATARSALDHGYQTTVIANACATREIPDTTGTTVTAAELHRVALAELADRFSAVVADLDQIPD